MSDGRCPLNYGEQEEAEIPTVRGSKLNYRRCPLDPGEHEEAKCEFFNSGSNQFTEREQTGCKPGLSAAAATSSQQVALCRKLVANRTHDVEQL